MLGCKPETYHFYNPIGKELINHRKLFLSKQAFNSFAGYATQQLRRLQAALSRYNFTQSQKEEHILKSCKSAMFSFNARYYDFDSGSISLYIDQSDNPDLDTEIFADINLTHYPARDYKNIIQDFNNIIKDYGKITQRNKKKDNAHLAKHAMHLIRLYLICIDIFEKEEIITYREKDLPLLMSIRNGEYQNPDGTFIQEFYDMIDDYERRLVYARDNTSLPDRPNFAQIEELTMYFNSYALSLSKYKPGSGLL
jgi:hypothetical protein